MAKKWPDFQSSQFFKKDLIHFLVAKHSDKFSNFFLATQWPVWQPWDRKGRHSCGILIRPNPGWWLNRNENMLFLGCLQLILRQYRRGCAQFYPILPWSWMELIFLIWKLALYGLSKIFIYINNESKNTSKVKYALLTQPPRIDARIFFFCS